MSDDDAGLTEQFVGYPEFFADLKARIRSAHVHAALLVNHERVLPYWQIGKLILVRQEEEGGAKVEFFDYFRNKDKEYAIEIGVLELFDTVNPKDRVPDFIPPQSFCYMDEPWGRV